MKRKQMRNRIILLIVSLLLIIFSGVLKEPQVKANNLMLVLAIIIAILPAYKTIKELID